MVVLLKLERRKRWSLVMSKERVVLREVLFFVLQPVNNTVLGVWFR